MLQVYIQNYTICWVIISNYFILSISQRNNLGTNEPVFILTYTGENE
jgi:hypothetical protein